MAATVHETRRTLRRTAITCGRTGRGSSRGRARSARALPTRLPCDEGDTAPSANVLEFDEAAAAELACERAFSARLEGGCSVPLGCSARAEDGRLVATGLLATPDGIHVIRDRISGGVPEAAALGRELADAIISSGGDDILDEIKQSRLEPPAAP